MATLKDLQDLMLAIPGVSPETATLIITELRAAMPGEKLYIPAHEKSNRKQAIIAAAKTLPTPVLVERFGVTRQYVHKLTRRKP